MKFSLNFSIFLFLISLSVALILSSQNYFVQWASLELSLIGFLPLFKGEMSLSSGIITSYFLVQVLGSACFLVSNFLDLQSYLWYMMCVLSLFLKVGLFPFIFWLPLVMSGMTWVGCAILNTVQKINPLLVLGGLSSSLLLFLLCVITALTCAILLISSNDLRSFMAFSGMAHTSWMVMAMTQALSLFFTYFLFYTLLVLRMFTVLDSQNINKTEGYNTNGGLFYLLLNLGSIPPTPFFFFKVLIVMMLSVVSPLVSLLLIFQSALSVYAYMMFGLPLLNKEL